MKKALLVIGIPVGITAIVAGSWAFRYYTAETRGIVGAEERIESAESRINNYEHFYDLCSVVQSREDALSSQRVLLESAENESERERVRANIAGLEAQRARAINQYNADASKVDTMARFLGDDLPKRLNANQEMTSC